MTEEFEAHSERVVRQVRDEIIDGLRAPGSKLVEREIAAELGVSRIPVRDALRELVAEGLVTPRPRTWAVVREFSAADVADLIEVRSAFEGLTFRLAATRATREGQQRLRAVLDREWQAARDGEARLARRAAADFHDVVAELSANDLLQELHRTLRSRLRWLLVQHDDLLAVAQEHQELYDAITARDTVAIDELVAEHLRSSARLAAQAHGN
ncbi:GntR family transcriptional regulator [Microlunatus soli]|uniref:DNA-binding transcriptional regulator, GntR family n=1 Tax=Microlunatus soli TaxID=630515 RepID=A0A1H1TPV5_9ACTN|nr:GntR family transcriptional regulator [Microlunatus soli]SDS62365.1 DNA-binding transcriptional regulator, GntR family [Microlunatus soli]